MIAVAALPRICVALGCADESQLQSLALNACDNGEEFLELRLDFLARPEGGIAVIRRILRRYPETVILATCRLKPHGGAFRGTYEQQLAILDDAVTAGAALVDVEIESAEKGPRHLEPLRERARLVLSYHNFERTPALTRVLQRLRKIPADIYKFATMARKPSDNLRILSLPASSGENNLVVLALGETGVAARILGPSRGSVFAFAAPCPKQASPGTRRNGLPRGEPTAPGQITADELRLRYQVLRRSSSSKIYGVVADPVGHSMSPVVHNRAFRARRLDSLYVPFLVRSAQLGDFFQVVGELPVAGFSVTIPHKRRVLHYLRSVDALAKRMGAVNTVFRRRGQLCGTNTDAAGVTVPLEKKRKIGKASVLVVGNGGAARGAIFALRDKGARVTLTGRNPRKAAKLARDCGVEAIERSRLDEAYFDILIHATPLGMYPEVKDCFFPDRIPADLVFDMVYNPIETALIGQARTQGKKTISGLEMFLEQAAAQFEIWTNESAPRTSMRNAVVEALSPTS